MKFSSTALAATTLAIAVLKSDAAEEDKKPVRNRLNGLKGTTINDQQRDLMSMPAIEGDGIMPGIPGQPDPALVPASFPFPDLANILIDAIPEVSVSGFLNDILNEKIIPPPTPPPTPTPTPPPTALLIPNKGWETYGDLPWFITSDFCGLDAPSDTCIHAGDIINPTNDLVGDPDVEVGGKKKKKKRPENSDGIEAITNNQYTTLENTFDFPEDGFLSFDMFCESEQGWDFCSVFIDDENVIEASGQQGWTSQYLQVSKGLATFKWIYSKDCVVSQYQDTMKLANIAFSPTSSCFASIPAVTITDTTV